MSEIRFTKEEKRPSFASRLKRAELRLALWPRDSIAHDTGLSVGPASVTEMTLGHNVGSKAEVDAVMAQAKAAGVVIVQSAHEVFWGGYSGYFQDPDGHLWEVVWNPQWEEEGDG